MPKIIHSFHRKKKHESPKLEQHKKKLGEAIGMDKKTHEKLLEQRKESIKGFKAKINTERSWAEKFADFLTESFGTLKFLIVNIVWFGGWIIVNTGLIPSIAIFDPYPFNFLTMVVSLEAIMLAIIVLMSQNRAADIDDLREEIDLHINVRAEEEITKILNIVDEIHDHMGLPNNEDDDELKQMKQKINLDEIERELKSESQH